MIKIKLIEKDIHRNETTFRPFLFAQNTLRDIGIEFTDSDDYDYAWVAQASIIDKEVSLEQSIEKGVNFISKITGDYMIVDGQDATSLIGTIDVFRESNALLFLKNSSLVVLIVPPLKGSTPTLFFILIFEKFSSLSKQISRYFL